MRKIFCIILFLCLAGGASAQPGRNGDAARHFEQGRALYNVKKYGAAQTEFIKARDLLHVDENSAAAKTDYYIALCAVEMAQGNSRELLEAFLRTYPNSVYNNDIRFALANVEYADGNYDKAEAGYAAVNPRLLPSEKIDEYRFKSGYSRFAAGEYERAYEQFARVSGGSPYGPAATYYMAYTDYTERKFEKAKKGFASLTDDESYGPLVPFYILQMEFEEGNYGYVTEHGDELLSKATDDRKVEILRITGESWFHLNDYDNTLKYMYAYRDAGGSMGREENYLMGYSSYKGEEYKEAADFLNLVCGPDDKLSQNASYHLADCYLHLGDKNRAMQSFSMASSEGYDPAISEDALFNYGKLQYELGNGVFNEAINILNRYLKKYPDSKRIPEVREYLISAYYNSRNYEEAYKAISQFPDPDNNIKTALQKVSYFRALEFYNEGSYAEALKLLNQSLENRFNPKYTALTYYWIGEILYNDGDYDGAAEKFDKYVRLSPRTEYENKIARYNIGYCHFNESRMDQAGSSFAEFLERYDTKDNFRSDALVRAGDANYVLRDFDKAIEYYDEAIALGLNDKYYAQYQKALVSGLLKKPSKKIESLRAIVAAGEGDYVDDATYELARTYMSMGRYSDASVTFKNFTEKFPDSEHYLPALSDWGLVYQNLDNSARAMACYKKIVETAPHSPQAREALTALRGIYVERNDVNGYFEYTKSLGIETDAGSIKRDSLSFAAAERVYMTGALDKASESLRNYAADFPNGNNIATALYYLGDCQVRSGRKDEAVETYKKLSQMPNNEYMVKSLQKLSALAFETGRYDDAAEAYLALSKAGVTKSEASAALTGYLRSTIASGAGDDRIMAAVEEIVSSPVALEATIREAKFAKASIIRGRGDAETAAGLYAEVATEVESEFGAEAAFRVIEHKYGQKSYDEAEKLIYAFSEKNSPRTYWVGKAFLVLGDIYVAKGDNFQARATYQSIVDGYSPADDGIVEEARNKIAALK